MILPVIMAGGSGTRLWPLSRGNYPKQFLSLYGDQIMLQQTMARLEGLNSQPSILICNEEHRFIAAEQIRQLGVDHNGILLEPAGRNTALAIALAAFKALENSKETCEPILLVLAADHIIENKDEFQKSVKQAYVHAQDDKLVTFGIVADKPETGYRYLKRGEPLQKHLDATQAGLTSFKVTNFVEKPNLETAQIYVDSGEFYWNSGMFMFKASRYLVVLKQFRPDIYDACEKSMQQQKVDNDFIRINKEAFLACPDESIDYAVMEPLCQQVDNGDAVIVPMDAGWNDIGGFSALWQVSEKDYKGNVFKGDVKATDTQNSLVMSDDKLVALVGVDDSVIVNTKDAILIAHKDKAKDVKVVVNKLKKENRSEATFHREMYRPWGKYDSLDNGERFQVKRITVNPGGKLSVQMHHHRAEHWIVVSGVGKITNGKSEILLTENQSTYIPIGVIHALENPGVIPLELIEVQSGLYLDEDDIVRFEDKYGRS